MRALARLGGLDQLILDILERLGLTAARHQPAAALPLLWQPPGAGGVDLTDQALPRNLEFLTGHLCPQQRHKLQKLGWNMPLAKTDQRNRRQLSLAQAETIMLRLAIAYAARTQAGRQEQSRTPLPKPSLALVSPMPPTASGIANYCRDLLPALAKQYDITLVVKEPADIESTLAQTFRTLNHRDFLLGDAPFDRIMYHFGNSHLHYDYFTLLKARPGVVVLHDIFLGDCIFSNFEQMGKTELLQYIYLSHGWPALLHCTGEVRDAIAQFPACAEVFTRSLGVIVHNRFAAEKLQQHFSARLLKNLRHTALAQKPVRLQDKASARNSLQLQQELEIYASFGFINHNKCIFELLDAWSVSGLTANPNARLYFVGDCDDAALRRKVHEKVTALNINAQVVITGYVDADAYDTYLAASDIALQLRRNSRGESSAALLDCMAAGLTTIINAHGSMADFPDGTVIKIADDFSVAELAVALNDSGASEQAGTDTGARAKRYVADNHAPEKVVTDYTMHIEALYRDNPGLPRNSKEILESGLADLSATALWPQVRHLSAEEALSHSRLGAPWGSQLLVDISAIYGSAPIENASSKGGHFLGQLLGELLQEAFPPYRVEPVYYTTDAGEFRYARDFASNLLGLQPLEIYNDPVEPSAGDVYLGLDALHSEPDAKHARLKLQSWRKHGVAVFSLLTFVPLSRDESGCDESHEDAKLQVLSQACDGVVAVSPAVARAYKRWLDHSDLPVANLQVSHLSLKASNPESTAAGMTDSEQSWHDGARQLIDSIQQAVER